MPVDAEPAVAAAGQRRRALRLRIASSLVLAPPALVAAWLGRPWFDLLVALGGVLMAWEWGRLADHGATRGCWLLVGVTVAVLATGLAPGGLALGVRLLAPAAIGLGIVGAWLGMRSPALLGLGVAAIGAPCLALAWLRADPVDGRATLLWVLALVWATDIGAYAAGRGLGGPKLAPRISPNKTWAGLAGGVLAAAATGAGAAALAGGSALMVAPLSALLAIAAQGGDLGESLLKRHFGVKDSGNLIPGHGGILDRVDGLAAAAPLVALLNYWTGSSILLWQ